MDQEDNALFELEDLPYLTDSIHGISGRIKTEPEDFVVEEMPAYEPSGTGEHLFLWVEKRDLSAEMLTRHVARSLQISQRAVGVAGLKDRRAITQQWISVPVDCQEKVSAIDTDQVKVLQAVQHQNKLKTGHLRGNRFKILIRDVNSDAATIATQVAEVIQKKGFPNYYGPQRFGFNNETLSMGFKFLLGEMTTQDISPSRRRFLLKLSLSAVQSYIFNRVLAERIRSQTLHTVDVGDVMQVAASKGPFVVTDVEREQQRYDERETVLTGPLWGLKMKRPEGVPLEREEAVLKKCGLSLNHFAQYRKLMPGARRPLIVWPGDLDVSANDDGVLVRVTLPAGVYATTLLREFQKESD